MLMPRPRKRLALLLSTALLLAAAGGAAWSPAAGAQAFGELGKPFFAAKTGAHPGEGPFEEDSFDHAFGVDPTTDDVYVGDQPGANEYRIQEFSPSGEFLHAVSLKFKGSQSPEGIEGIAVDAEKGVIYALVQYEREGREGNPKFVDPELFAAGTLFAFTTELTPAGGTTSEGELVGVLDSTTALNAQSEVVANPAQSALIEPSGIAVDPTTHDVIILAKEEQCNKKTSECEEELLTVAQRVEPTGTLGKRWVDTGECFQGLGEGAASCFKETHAGETKEEELEESAFQPGEPNSPIVTSSGRVLVDVIGGPEIWEIPKSFESGTATADAPKPLPIESGGVPELRNPLQKLLFFPSAPEPTFGGGLSYVHEATEGPSEEGRIYQLTDLEGVAAGNQTDPGILTLKLFSNGTASEVGWTGGQTKIEQEHQVNGGCWLSVFSQPTVGAGAKTTLEGKEVKEVVFAFDPNVPPGTGEGSQSPPKPQVVTFGSGGSRCATASASAPAATLNGTAVGSTTNPVIVGTTVTLSSKLTAGNALAVQWTFPEATKSVGEPQFQTTKIQYAFTSAGEKTVTEKITTDNLAEPTVTVTGKIVVATSSGKGGGTTTTTTTTPPPITTPPPTTTPTPTTTTPTTTTPGGEVKGNTVTKGNPAATLASTSLTVSSSGGFPAKVSCPAGETTCSGTITLKTLTAVSAGKGKKKAILTLASGSFSVAGGGTKSITLHLSAAARKLLTQLHQLRARATIAAHDTTGGSHTTVATVTLKPAKKKSAHH
jgi:hypothetical protein